MRKSLDLNVNESKPAQLPPVLRPRPSNIPGIKGQLPLSLGEVILSEQEKIKLRQLGWKDGDPLPGNMAQLLHTAEQEAKDVYSEAMTLKPPQDHPTLKMPREVQLKHLSPERQKEYAGYFEKFKEMAPQIEAAAAAKSSEQMAALTPGVQKALDDAGVGVRVTDSRASDFQQRINIAEGKEVDPETEPDRFAEDDTVPQGMPGIPDKCKRCGWNQAEDPDAPSKDDMLAYTAAILGSTPFLKAYSLLGGRLSITLRQLSTNYIDESFSQVARESRAGLIGPTELARQLTRYRTLLAIETITTDGHEVWIANSVDEFMRQQPGEPLPKLAKQMLATEPLNSSAIWKLACNIYITFSELCETLEAKADEPDFWNAIEG